MAWLPPCPRLADLYSCASISETTGRLVRLKRWPTDLTGCSRRTIELSSEFSHKRCRWTWCRHFELARNAWIESPFSSSISLMITKHYMCLGLFVVRGCFHQKG